MINLITTTQELQTLCQTLKKQPFITLDTEFLREKTYYPQLCLLQIGSPEISAIVDPMAPDLDLTPFYELLTAPEIVKVFHAGRQDIEIFYHLAGIIPTPLFDTQIAASACGFGDSASYESLVNKITKRSIDKTCRYTNWGTRPLDEKQLAYAIGDVTHLIDIYLYLKNYLEEHNRLEWIIEETAVLQNPKTYICPPQDAWLKIRRQSHNPKFLTLLKELAAWREKRAQDHDVPRQLILKDECLQSIAAAGPDSLEKLITIRNLRKDVATGKLGTEILEVVAKVNRLSPDEYIREEASAQHGSCNPSLLEMLRLLLKICGQKHEVSTKLIASDDDLRDFAAGNTNCSFASGWRHMVFGADAQALCAGELSLCYNPKLQDIELVYLKKDDGFIS